MENTIASNVIKLFFQIFQKKWPVCVAEAYSEKQTVNMVSGCITFFLV